MTMLIYAAVAIVFLVLVLGLFGKTRPPKPEQPSFDGRSALSTGSRRWLHLSERIFDASDVRWLAEELAFPKLARELALDRKRLAIGWLEALETSFDQVVRTPEVNPNEAPNPSGEGWKTLWLAVRFKLLISYALMVVRLFGPYHRLMPSFSWVPFYPLGQRRFEREALAHHRSVR